MKNSHGILRLVNSALYLWINIQQLSLILGSVIRHCIRCKICIKTSFAIGYIAS